MTAPAIVWDYRTLISNLALRDLRSRYKKSLLGWLWSLLNPATTLAIYTIVFGVFLKGSAPNMGSSDSSVFAMYLFAGLVVWNAFSGGVNNAIGSFLASGGLLTRTYFPPECPVIAGALTVLSQTVLESAILLVFMAVLGNLSWTTLLVVPILALVTIYAFGIGLIVALLNVRFRDVGYLVGLALQVMFYATPIVYPITLLDEHPLAAQIIRFNPMTHFVGGMRNSVYLLTPPTLVNWAAMILSAAVMLLIGWWFFARNAPRFIEEI